MRTLARFVFVTSLIALYTGVLPAQAQTVATGSVESATLPAGIFRMADGKLYQPSTGITATTIDAFGIVPPVDTRPALFKAIELARANFDASIQSDELLNPTPRVVGDEDFWRDVTLAVWNSQTNAITYVHGRKKGRALELEAGASGITVRRSNYINSEYALENPNERVVAVRYPIQKSIAGKTDTYTLHDVVYTPYAREMHTPEAVEAGKAYLYGVIRQALDGLRADGVPSRTYPEKLLADTVDPELLRSLITIEHSDAAMLRRDANQALERIYVIFALNRGTAFNYSRSSAGALGIAQFIPKTYASFVRRESLKLNPDFEVGMRDHVNTVRVQIAYIDDALAHLPAEARAAGGTNPKVHEYLAAAYNGGYAKVRTAIKIWDEQISGELKPAEILRRSRLRAETIEYVKKLRALRTAVSHAIALNP